MQCHLNTTRLLYGLAREKIGNNNNESTITNVVRLESLRVVAAWREIVEIHLNNLLHCQSSLFLHFPFYVFFLRFSFSL